MKGKQTCRCKRLSLTAEIDAAGCTTSVRLISPTWQCWILFLFSEWVKTRETLGLFLSSSAEAQQMCCVQQTDQLRGHVETTGFLQFGLKPAEPRAAGCSQNNLFRLKTGASCVSPFFETSCAPHWSVRNEAYVVYAFRQTHNYSTFTAWTGALAGASASRGRHAALIGWVSATLWQIAQIAVHQLTHT